MTKKGDRQCRYGIILPSGNREEFADIRAQLRQRGVNWFERKLFGTSTIFWLYESELSKLPTDHEGLEPGRMPQYIPVEEESGHGISHLDKFLDANPGEDMPHLTS